MKLLSLITIFVFFSAQISAQKKDLQTNTIDTLPLNSETQKVSILKVVEFKDLKKEEIYNRLNDWYQLKVDGIKNQQISKKRDKNGEPQIISIQYYNFDENNLDSLSKNKQKVMYKVVLSQIKKIGVIGPLEMSGLEHSILVFLIKDGKVKFEFSDFFHEAYGDAGLWPYELKKVKLNSKNWLSTRIESVNKYEKVANELIEYIKKPSRTNMDF